MLLWISMAMAMDYAPWRTALADEAGWEVVGTKNVAEVGDVLIRHKVIQGHDCLEGSTSATLPADALLAAASDIPTQPAWSSWAVKASVKLSGGGTGFDYYQLLDNPFPINDRYWFVRATVVSSGPDRRFQWEAIDPAKYPEALASVLAAYPDAVMTGVNVGDWTFTPAGSSTKIRYRICTDVGGKIPDWAGEYAARTTLPTNLADLVKEVRRRLG